MAEVTEQLQNLTEYESDGTEENFEEILVAGNVGMDVNIKEEVEDFVSEAIDEQENHHSEGLNEHNNINDESEEPEAKQEHEHQPVEEVTGGGDRWPGWPGESVFRMLIPAQKVGGLIGRKGEYIKKITEETKERIKVLDAPPGITERAVMVSATEDPDASHPPAINAILKVHQRVVDGLDSNSSHPPPGIGSRVTTRLLVPGPQAGSLIGKHGATIKSIQEGSNCIVRVLRTEELPEFSLKDDHIVEVVGDPICVHKAVELIASQLRKFLVDRSIISLIETRMYIPHPQIERAPPQLPGPPPQGFPLNSEEGQGFGASHFMPAPRKLDTYYPPAEMPPALEMQPHQGTSPYRREPSMAVHESSNRPALSRIPQITQHMQVPLSYADAVIGSGGANISYIRRISGATVTVQESRGAPREMTVEITGTASQVQTAQQTIQKFMTVAAGQSQAAQGGAVDQGYDSYGARSTMYPPAASTTGQSQAAQGGAVDQGYDSYGARATMYPPPASTTGQSQAAQGGAVDQGYDSYGARATMYPPGASTTGLSGQAVGGYSSAYSTKYGY